MPRLRLPLPILLLILQLPLVFNPGYFSHDDLEWIARADVPAWVSLPWVSWLDLSPLQYRPLTFNLWLVLAHAFGATPALLHLACVILGTLNAWLLWRVLIGARISERIACGAAIVFTLSPYVVYVHGWTGALADLLTLALGLGAARCLQCALDGTRAEASVLVATSTALIAAALLSKESAIVLPFLLPFAAYRDLSLRAIRIAVALATLVAVLYLALRWPILVNSADVDSAYTWSLRNVPTRLAEYILFPFTPPLFEIAPLLDKSVARLLAAAGCVSILLVALWTRGPRWPLAWLFAFGGALAPILVLPRAYDQYAYLASAVAIAIPAAAWSILASKARIALAVVAAIVTAHGAIIMSRIHAVGIIQHTLFDDVLTELRASPEPLYIVASDPRDAWLLGRLLDNVVVYRGVTLRGRIAFGETPPSQTSERVLQMDRNGHLHAAGASLTPH